MRIQVDTICPVCGSHHCTVQAVIGVEAKQSVVRCAECKLEFAHPFRTSSYSASSAITSEGYIQRMLNDYAAVQPLLVRRASLRIERYTALLGKRPKRMLEIGSGPGWMVKTYMDHGIEVLGLEIDQTLIAASVPGAVVLQGDICTIDPSGLGSFDVIYSSQTLEHILTPAVALRQMIIFLRPGGLLHLDVPNGNSWGARIRRIHHTPMVYGAISLPHHQIAYTPTSMRWLLAQNGLDVVSISEFPTDDDCYGQTILPNSLRARVYMTASRLLGHGYLLVALARKR